MNFDGAVPEIQRNQECARPHRQHRKLAPNESLGPDP